MAIVITPGITIEGGINFDNGFVGPAGSPDIGTTVEWADDTYFDAWTSQISSTTDIPSSYTNNIVWGLFYSWQQIQIPGSYVVPPQSFRVATTTSGTNTVSIRIARSTVDNTLGSFNESPPDISFGAPSGSYTAGGYFQGTTTATQVIPPNRYFLLGFSFGPYYRSMRALAANRTATISGSPVVTVINKLWRNTNDGTTAGIPTQLGGVTANFIQNDGYVPVASFVFQLA